MLSPWPLHLDDVEASEHVAIGRKKMGKVWSSGCIVSYLNHPSRNCWNGHFFVNPANPVQHEQKKHVALISATLEALGYIHCIYIYTYLHLLIYAYDICMICIYTLSMMQDMHDIDIDISIFPYSKCPAKRNDNFRSVLSPGASVLTAPVDSLDRFGAMCLGADVVVAARGIHHGKSAKEY